jgi:hypothetical protein
MRLAEAQRLFDSKLDDSNAAVESQLGSPPLTPALRGRWVPTNDTSREAHTAAYLAAHFPRFALWASRGRNCERWQEANASFAYAAPAGAPSLPVFDPTAACGALRRLGGGRGVLLVGDSVQAHFALQIAALLSAPPCNLSLPTLPPIDPAGLLIQLRLCACADGGDSIPIVFVRNDWLLPTTSETAGDRCAGGDERCLPWADASFLANFAVVVINAGAHYQPDEALLPRLADAAARVVESGARLLVYRSTAAGHGDCERLQAPFASAELGESWVRERPWHEGPLFAGQNRRAWAAVAGAAGGRAALLDAWETSLARGEVHQGGGDCLHYCVPAGPMMAWADALAGLLEKRVTDVSLKGF